MDSATSSARDSEAKDKETTISKNKLPLQSWDYEANQKQKTNSHIRAGTTGRDTNLAMKTHTHRITTKKKQNIKNKTYTNARPTITNTTLASQLGQLAVARQIKKTQYETQWIVAQRLRKRRENNKNKTQTQQLPLQNWDYEENNNQKQTLTSELGLQAGTKIEQ